MVSTILSTLFLTLITATLVIAKSSFPSKCDNVVVPVNTPNGTLTISGTSGSCIWNFISGQIGTLVIVVEESALYSKDTVHLEGAQKETLGDFKDVLHPGVFIATVPQNGSTLTIALHTESSIQRDVKYHFNFLTKLDPIDVTAQNTNQFVIPLNSPTVNPFAGNLKFNVKPPQKASLIQVKECNNNCELDGPGKLAALATQKEPSVLTLNGFNTSTSSVVLAFETVDPACSGKYDSPASVTFNLQSATMFQPVCAAFITAPNKLFVNITGIESLPPSDSITFYNGPSLNSTISLQLVSTNVAEEKSKISNKLLGTSSIIIYRVSSASVNAAPVVLPLSPAVKSKINEESVTVEGGTAEYFIYQAPDSHKRVAFTSSVTTGVLTHFYCQDDLNAAPFLTISEKQSLPNTVYSPSNFLRVVTMDKALSGKFSLIDGNAVNTTLCEESDALTLKIHEIPVGTSVELVIPSRGAKDASVHVSPLLLNPGDTFTIERLDNPVKQILREEYSSSIEDAFLLPINLRGLVPHRLTFHRGSSDVTNTNLKLSLTYADPPQPVNVSLVSDETYRISQPLSSLEYYETTSDSRILNWNANLVGVNESLVHLSFSDLQFADHFSNINLGKEQSVHVIAQTLGHVDYDEKTRIVPDFVGKQLLLQLQSNLPPVNARGSSGRGFFANMRRINCGGSVTYPESKTLSSNGTDCIWTVNSSSGKLLKMNVTFKGDGKRGNLTIFDDLSSGSSHLVNTTHLNETLISMKSGVVISYHTDKDEKDAPVLTVTLGEISCSDASNGTESRCDFNERCILPSKRCDGNFDCDDKKDEMHCNSTGSVPPNPSLPSSGLSGWTVVLLIMPMTFAVGFISHMYGPRVIGRFRNSRYSDFSNLAEDA